MREGLTYEDWKKELNIWRKFTDLSKQRQGGALFLTLTGKARETVLAEVPLSKFDEKLWIHCTCKMQLRMRL